MTQLQGKSEDGLPIFGGGNFSTTEDEKGKARDKAAKATGTNGRYGQSVTVMDMKSLRVEHG